MAKIQSLDKIQIEVELTLEGKKTIILDLILKIDGDEVKRISVEQLPSREEIITSN